MEHISSAPDGAKAVHRALDVLEFVATAPSDVGVTEVATALRFPKSTTHRLLGTLAARGLIEQNPASERYQPGLRLFTLGSRALERTTERGLLRGRAHLYLQELVDRVGETVYLSILDGNEVLYVDCIEGKRAMRAAAPVGTRRPIYCTAVGKVLLSRCDLAEIDRLVAGVPMEPRTATTITSLEEFHLHVAKARTDRYALDIGEFEEGLACMAAPVFGSTGAIVAAIGLTGPSWRLVNERLDDVIAALCDTAHGVSTEMGFRASPQADHLVAMEEIRTRTG